MPESAPTPEQMFALLRKVVDRLKALEARIDGLEQSAREVRSGAAPARGRSEEEIRSERVTQVMLGALVSTLKTLNNNYVSAHLETFEFKTLDDDE